MKYEPLKDKKQQLKKNQKKSGNDELSTPFSKPVLNSLFPDFF